MFVSFASMTAFFTAYAQSDYFGKIIILGLLALSMLCWIVLIHKIWMVHKVRKISSAFQKAFEHHKQPLLNLDLADFPKPKSAAVPHPFAQIFNALQKKSLEVLQKNQYFMSQTSNNRTGVHLTPNDFDLLESYAATAISSQTKELEKNLFVLSTIVTLAPFLGLLGTVWGILLSFSGLHEGGAASSNAAILGGLSTALATTVLGLVIAIPALVSYNYLRNALRHYATDMNDFLSIMISSLEMQYRKVE